MRQVIRRNRSEFDRGLGFFDAVFGFAITLLVANIDLPPASAWASVSELLGHGLSDQLVGFIVSFVVIALFWKVNTGLIGRLRGMDGVVIAANLLVVGLVVFIPFTTQGISDSTISELPLPVAVYAVNVAAVILAQSVMFEVARARGLVEDDDPPGTLWLLRIDTAIKVAVFLVSIPVAYLVSPGWGMTTWALLLVVSPLFGRVIDRAQAEARARAGASGASADTVPPADTQP